MQKSKRRLKYEKHIASPEWKQKRLERIAIDNNQCRLCGSTDRLEVHHKWPSGYYNLPNESVQDDLTTLCNRCHEAFHNSMNEREYQNKSAVLNTVPETAKRKLTSYGMESSKISTSRNMPDDPTQRRFSEPDELSSKSYETYIGQTKKDRGRFRGIG